MRGRRLIDALARPLRRRPTSPDDVERAELAFYEQRLAPGMTVLDVGAHTGEMTLLFAHLVGAAGAVHAFEPVEPTYERLVAAIEAQALTNVTALRLAVADVVGERTLHVYGGDYLSWSSLADRDLDTYGIPAELATAEQVPATTLDAYCAEHGLVSIDLLKIDAEGAELQVLRGARGLLEERRIAACIFEFGQTTFDMGNDPRELRTFVESVGYRLRNVVDGDPVFPGGRAVESAEFSMHLALPR